MKFDSRRAQQCFLGTIFMYNKKCVLSLRECRRKKLPAVL